MSTQLTPNIFAAPGDLTLNTSTPQVELGTKIATNDGREYRYVKAGAVALVPGTLLQAPAETTTAQDLAVTATAIGSFTVTTTTTLTATANQFTGGSLIVTVTPGQGYQYKIGSHPAVTGAALTLTLIDPIQVALTTGSRIDLVASPYSGVLINPASASSAPIGAAVYPITALYYGWAQVHGPCTLLSDGGTAVGLAVVASNATAGAVETLTGTQAPVGTALTGVATTEYGAFMLEIE